MTTKNNTKDMTPCNVCEEEFMPIGRKRTCSKKECSEIASALNLNVRLKTNTKKLHSLKELWRYNHLRWNLIDYSNYETFKTRMEALDVFEEGMTLKEIANDTQILINRFSNTRK